jgi:hypothetical protein
LEIKLEIKSQIDSGIKKKKKRLIFQPSFPFQLKSAGQKIP